MTIVFWTCVVLVLYVYLGYPAIMWLASRWRPQPWTRVASRPTVSVILAVYNGAALLREKIEHLLTLDYPEELIEVLVVSDGSTDDTDAILKAMQHPRLRTWRLAEHRGKVAALNQAIQEARHEILLFIDIRPRLEAGALASLVSNFADPKVGAAAGELRLRSGDHDAGSRAVGGLYWRYEQWIRTSESAIDSAVGVYGGFYAVRRSLAVQLPEGLILDDMLQPLSVIRQGYRCVLDESALVWDVWPKTAKGEFRRKVRTLAGNFQLVRVAPWLLTRENRVRAQFISHKLLRLVAPALLFLALLSSLALAHQPLYLWLAVGQLCFYLLGVLGLRTQLPGLRQITGPAAAFCLLNAAAIAGFWQFIAKGKNLQKIWVPSE
jgi:cellulose synthase/poly-beta-1,6-N-acetylglucosamine synthase-like glycosyltransferase